MRPASFLSHATLLCGSLAAAQAFAGESVMSLRINGQVEVDPAGRVVSHELHTPMTEALRTQVERKVADLSFAPPMQPVPTRGAIRISLSARPQGDAHAVRFDDVAFVPDTSEQSPRGYWDLVDTGGVARHRLRATGAVSMAFRVAPDGRVLDAFPQQCTVFAVRPGLSMQDACRDLERHGEKLVLKMKGVYRPAPGEAMPTGPGTGVLPLTFTQGIQRLDKPRPGQWRKEWRTAYKQAPWSGDDSASRIAEAEEFLLDSSHLGLSARAGSES